MHRDIHNITEMLLVTVKVAMIQLFTDRLCTVDSPDGVVMKSEMHMHSTRHSCPALHHLLSLVWLHLGVGLREGENGVIMSEIKTSQKGFDNDVYT